MRILTAAVFAFLLLALPAVGQELLPASFGGWTGSALSTIEPAVLETVSGIDAQVLREFGARRAERRKYTRSEGQLTLTLYHMGDPTGAYGAFLFLRGAEMQPAEISALSAWGGQRALAVVGHLLLEATAPDMDSRLADVKLLAAQLAPNADRTPFPNLEQYLPERGLLPDSKRYLLGPVGLDRLLPLGRDDWAGFSAGAEVQLARYRVRGEEATLLLLYYPTPQAAQQRMAGMATRFQLNLERPDPAGASAVYARRSGTLVAMVAQVNSRTTAEHLLRQVEYETHVTWNEPAFMADEEEWSLVLYSVFVGTGLLVLYMLAVAFVFGGFRLLIKRLLPGKVFDRPETMDVLQLGLGSKPIEGKDFYNNPFSR